VVRIEPSLPALEELRLCENRIAALESGPAGISPRCFGHLQVT
jgi:hypothetical protein